MDFKNLQESQTDRYRKLWKTSLFHCVKSVRIRSFSGLYFPVFGLNTEIYRINLRIQYKYRKIQTTKKTPNADTFDVVLSSANGT